MTTSGTKEWADSNVNIYSGCSHNCLYCYAKGMAIRFKRKTDENWQEMDLNEKAFGKNYKQRSGRIMFPSSHDITRETIDVCLITIRKLLQAGNHVLITTKMGYPLIKDLLDGLKDGDWDKDHVQFRFTITSSDAETAGYWEPGAPNPQQRLVALSYAKDRGYKTSVSIEPFLDHWNNLRFLISLVEDRVTESIWIGPMNRNFCPAGKWDEKLWGKDNLAAIYTFLKDHPKIRFKDSFRNQLSSKA